MRMKMTSRVGLAATISAVALLVLAPSASANWTSSITRWQVGDESRRWTDESYSEVRFKNCYGDDGALASSTIELYRVVDNSPDVSYGGKTFTNCFKYIKGADVDYVSAGAWTGLPYSAATYDGDEYKGGYYFALEDLSGDYTALDVQVVAQDTTQAD